MTAPVLLGCGALVAAVLGACTRPPVKPPPATRPPGPALEGPTWVLVSDLGTPPPSAGAPVAGRPITATFTRLSANPQRDVGAGRVAGSSGCNTYSGSYTLDHDRLTVGPIVSTEMACDPNTMRWEQAYLGRLERTASFTVDRAGLHLRGADGAELLGFTATPPREPPSPAPGSPVGSWRVTTYRGPDGPVPVVEGSPVQLTFEAGGRLSGRACNIFGGTWSVSGDAIRVRAEWMTEMACVSEPAMEQEAHFLQALQAAAHWRVDRCPPGAMCFAPDSLALTDAAGNPVVTAFVGGAPTRGTDLPPDAPVSSPELPTTTAGGG